MDPENPPLSVLVCPKCAAQVEADGDSLYCDQCGASLKAVRPTQATALSDPLKALPSSGTCPDCGGNVVEISEDHGRCRGCGANLVEARARTRQWAGLIISLASAGAAMLAVNWMKHRG